MNIKKFIGNSAREAIQMVKKEMGDEAVILRTRTVRSPENGSGDRGKKIEVTAAIDYEPKPETAPAQDQVCLKEILDKWRYLEAELKELKAALMSADAGATLRPEIYFNQSIRSRFENYRSFGLKSEIISDLMKDSRENGTKPQDSSAGFLRESLSKVLSRIETTGGHRQKKGRKILSFIGPTGVGKTTTLAKLAAMNAVKQGKKAALITLDTFRIAAVAQLESYARIMGIPLDVAVSRQELQKAIGKHRDCDLVLIDTAGRSPNQAQEITELKEILNVPEKIHGYLVLSATEQYENLLYADKSFGALPLKSYIFTKLDETRDASSMINFLITRDKPVSYFTAGQQVPEDIEVASKKKIASLILAGMHERATNSRNEVNAYGSSNWA